MKKTLYILIFLVSFDFATAQKFVEKNFQIIRIPLKEKFNLSARSLPRLLTRAYCEGKIIGYYPWRPDLECGYHEFAAHFNIAKIQPVANGDAFEDVECPSNFCINKDEESISPFCLYFDVIEDKVFNTQKSAEQHNIKYIRLIYSIEKHGMEIFYTGPIFMYEDVIKLNGNEFSMFNPKNDAASISFKQYFEARMFSGFSLGTGTQPKKTNPNQEKDKWQH